MGKDERKGGMKSGSPSKKTLNNRIRIDNFWRPFIKNAEMVLVNSFSTPKSINNENESMLDGRSRKEVKVIRRKNKIKVLNAKNRDKVVNGRMESFSARSPNNMIFRFLRYKRIKLMNIGNGRRKRKVLSGENKTIINERLNGAILLRNVHIKSIVNEVMFNTKRRSSSNKNNFDVIIKESLLRDAGLNKSSLNGLMFASGDMRFVNKDENILKTRNFFDERGKLIAMENIVPKLKRETLFSLLGPFGRRMTSNNENIAKR